MLLMETLYFGETMYRILFLLLTAQFVGCMYGNDLQVNYTPINNLSFEETYEVTIYWGETKPNSVNYKQIAFLEVIGPEYTSAEALLYEMKKKAMTLGADAVMEVKQNYIRRESGELISELTGKSKPDTYTTIALTGIAIRFP